MASHLAPAPLGSSDSKQNSQHKIHILLTDVFTKSFIECDDIQYPQTIMYSVWGIQSVNSKSNNHVIPHITWPIQNVDHHRLSGDWRPTHAGWWAYTSNFVKHILFFKWKLITRSGHNISHYKTAKLMIHMQKLKSPDQRWTKKYYKQFLYKITLNGSETIITRKFPLQ